MTELRKLIEAVEAGESINLDALYAAGILKDWSQGYTLVQAMGGSLDCAHKLHDALLPEWRVFSIHQKYKTKRWFVGLDKYYDQDVQVFSINEVSPARAWLIAILKAYEARK